MVIEALRMLRRKRYALLQDGAHRLDHRAWQIRRSTGAGLAQLISVEEDSKRALRP